MSNHKMKSKKGRPSNYTKISVFLFLHHCFSDLNIIQSIDVVNLSIHWKQYASVQGSFKEKFGKYRNYYDKEDNTNVQQFKCGDSKINLCRSPIVFKRPLIKLLQPDKTVVNAVLNILRRSNIEYLFSYVEIAFDLGTADLQEMKDYIYENLYVRNLKAEVKMYEDSLYYGSQTSAKTITVYEKKTYKPSRLRLEVRLRRSFILRTALCSHLRFQRWISTGCLSSGALTGGGL